MASTKAIWVPPLPSGWEARFDPSKRTYFFINHQTKTTQWEDPRFPQAHPPNQNTQNTAASAAFQSLGQISGHKAKDGSVSLPLQEFNHSSHSKTFLGSDTESLKSESTFSSDLNMAVANKLHTEFPKLPREIVVDILMLCHNSEREAREQLKDICSTDSNTSSSHHTPQRTAASGNGSGNASLATPNRLATADPSPKKQPARSASPHNHQNKKKQGKSQPPPAAVKAEISEAEKTRAFNIVKSGYPNLDTDVITIALSHCNYNIEETTQLVAAWEKKKGEEDQKLRSARVASGGNSGSSPSHVFVPPTMSLEPAGLDDAAANKPQGLSQAHPNSHRPGPRPGAKGVAAESSVPPSEPHASKAKGSNGSSALALGASDANSVLGPSHHHESAQHVTRMSEHLLNTTNDLLNHLATTATCCAAEDEEVLLEVDDAARGNATTAAASATSTVDHSGKVVTHPKVVVHQPTAAATHGEKNVFMSALRTANKGPNAELRRGPNSSLLTSDYTHANGPNKSLRSGPDKTRLSGPKGAQGPNTSLPCGPQSSLLQKNQINSSPFIHAASTYVSTHV